MKILHCCFANSYIDNYGYQENVITRIHKAQGHDVLIAASTETIKRGGGIVYTEPSEYINEDGITVHRLPYTKLLPHAIAKKVRIYTGVNNLIRSFKPDIVFMHDAQTAAVFTIVRYVKENPSVKLYIDSHTDFVNSAHGWVSKHILHGILYKFYVRETIPYTCKYYGTLPARVDFYRDFYGTPPGKTEYLPLGVDDITTDFSQRDRIRKSMRQSLGIGDDDFVIVSGGRLEKRKNTILLLKAFSSLSELNIKLLLFGSVSGEIKSEWESCLPSDGRIIYTGWVPSAETYKYFFASDLACFPGTHSTLWEEAVGYGVPCIFKKWNGIQQIDLGGNCLFVEEEPTIDSLCHSIRMVLNDGAMYSRMKEVSMNRGIERFSYSKIARYAIEQ